MRTGRLRALARSRKAKAMAALGVLLASGLLPLATSDHLGGLPFFGEPDPLPRTGNGTVDGALALLDGLARQGVDRYNELARTSQEPQLPTVLFVDSFEPDRRIGGWGDWNETTGSPRGWFRTGAAALEGDLGYQWLDPATGYYPIAVSLDEDAITRSFLVSPRISLESLPVDAQAGPQPVDRDLADGVPSFPREDILSRDDLLPPRIDFSVQHRYHFAQETDANGQMTGRDGGRIKVFQDHPPTAATIRTDGTILVPEIGVNETGEVRDASTGMATAFGDNGHAFMGPQQDPVVDHFDLTRFAGHDIWIVAEAASEPTTSRAAFFASDSFFDLDVPMRGWHLDDLRIEGPTFAHNVFIDEILAPRFPDPSTGGVIVSSEDGEPFRMLVVNHGQFSEDVDVGLGLDPDGSRDCVAAVPRVHLRPGEVREAVFTCPDLADGESFTAAFMARIPDPDAHPSDNHLDVPVQARRGLRFSSEPVVVDPRLGSTSDVRHVLLELTNQGFSRERVDLELSVFQRAVAGEPNEGENVNVTDCILGIVVYSSAPCKHRDEHPERQSVLVSADPDRVENRRTVRWDIELTEPGEYTLKIHGAVGGGTIVQREATAGSLLSPSVVFQDLKGPGSEPVRSIVHPDFPDWNVTVLGDARPPCHSDGTCPKALWELAPFLASPPKSALGGTEETVMRASLRGEIVLAERPELTATTEIDRLEITYLHTLTTSCEILTNSVGECPLSYQPPSSPTQLVRFTLPQMNLHAAVGEFGRGVGEEVLQAIVGRQSANLSTEPLYRTHPVNRQSYYNQWVEESYTIELGGPQRTSLPAQVIERAQLEFQSLGSACPSSAFTMRCPLWRVAYASVTAVTADGGRHPILATTGHPEGEGEIGDWKSQYSTGKQEELSPYTSCAAAEVQADPSAHAGRELRCPSWLRRETADLPAHPQQWRRSLSELPIPESRDVWTNVDPQSLVYADGVHEILVSPALTIQDNLPDPYLSIRHQFNFQRFPETGGGVSGFDDGGMLMVRFMKAGQGGLQPDGPFLPVVLFPGNGGPEAKAHRFRGTDCGFYLSGDDATACEATPLSSRPMSQQGFSLKALPILDYRDVRYDRELQMQRVLHNPTGNPSGVVTDSSKTPNGLETGGLVPNPVRDPDASAYRVVDLTTACGGPCTVQFGFKVDTWPGQLQLKDTRVFCQICPIDRTVAKNTAHTNADGKGEGWYLGEMTVLAERSRAHDLEVLSGRLEASYNWTGLGLGPGTPAQMVLTVRNNGLFKETYAERIVDIRGAGGVTQLRLPSDPAFAVEPGAEAEVTIPFTLPTVEGDYQVGGRLDMRHPAEGRPGLFLDDEEPDNNCIAIYPDGSSVVQCALDSAPGLLVKANPRLELDLQVTPRAGLPDFPRSVEIQVNNTGNVVVRGATLRLGILPLSGGGAPSSFTWTLAESPPPGLRDDWSNLTLLDDEGTVSPPLSTIVLGERDAQASQRFLLRAQVLQDGLFASAQALADAFSNLYSDTFEEEGLSRDRVVVAALPLTSPGGWNLTPGVDFDGEGENAWLFGGLDSGRYPARANASLLLPPLDLSSVSQASLSFAHRYDFERGYDGGIVEASLDGGATWSVLDPVGGYPMALQASNPLVPGNDPARQLRGFSGSSLPRMPSTGGWVIDEFDLGQLPGVTTPIVVQRLDQEDFSNLNVQRDTNDERISFANSWALPAQGCPAGCWYRENLHHHDPVRDPAVTLGRQAADADDPPASDPAFWWTGTAGRIPANLVATTTLPLELTVPSVPGQQPRLTYWAWKDDGGALSVTLLTANGPLTVTPTPLLSDPVSGWTRYNIALGTQAGQSIQVNFTYTEPLGAAAQAANRGAVLDDVQLEQVRFSGGTLQVVKSVPLASGNTTAWRTPLAAPSGHGLMWHAVPRIADVPEAWSIARQDDHQGQPSEVWWMGSLDDVTGRYSYPPNAAERLATPLLSLKGIGGDQASLQYWERYDMGAGDIRRILVQPLVASADGDVPGPWSELDRQVGPPLRTVAGTGGQSRLDCEGTAEWCLRQVDVSRFIGQSVRFAFELESNRLNEAIPQADTSIGYHWAIDDVAILAESFVGDRMLLRLRAGTDPNIDEGSWAVDNLQLVGRIYSSNLALLPDQAPGDLKLPAGSTLDLTGFIRNLGRELERDVFLSVQATPLDVGGVPPVVTVASPIEVPGGLAGPVNLAIAGTVTSQGLKPDRTPFGVGITIPAEAGLGSRYRVALTLLQRDVRGELAPPAFDENLGDHERTWDIAVGVVKDLRVEGFTVSEPAVASGATVGFAFDLANHGNQPTEATATVKVLDVGSIGTGEELQYTSSPLHASLAPGERVRLGTTWEGVTGTDLQRVVVHLEATEGGLPSPPKDPTVGHMLVNATPVFFRDGFESDPLVRWTPSSAAIHSACAGSTNTQANPLGQWRTTNEDSFDGTTSFLLGATGPEAILGATYLPGRDELLTGPRIDLRDLADLNEIAPGPLTPNLLIHYKADLGANDGIVVQGYTDFRATLPFADGPAGFLSCNNPLVDPAVYKPLSSNAPRREAIAQDTIAWRSAQFSLGGEVLVREGGISQAVLGREARPVIRFGSDSIGESSGILVDGITVSSYDVRVSPASQHIVLRNGADKVQYLRIENRGAATDRYTIQQDPALGELPAIVQFEVLDPEVTLAPGQSALVRLALRVDPSIPRSLGAQTVGVQVASTEDPGRTVQATLSIGQVLRSQLPDLDVRLKRPAGEAQELGEGDATTFLASVTNRGGASRPAGLVILACPDLGETAATLASCAAAPGTSTAADDPLVVLGAGKVPALDAGANVAQTLNWVAPAGSAGDYIVAAIVDPDRVNRQANTVNDVALLPLRILPSQTPDLEVVSLAVQDSDGVPVQRGFEGQSFVVTATFRNAGSREATDVQLRLLSRFPLLEERIARMGPGQEATLSTRLTAEAGNLIVIAEASTPVAESRSDNNVLKASLAVLRGRVEATFSPDTVAVQPGQSLPAILHLRNLRDRPVEARLEVLGPDDLVLSGLPESVDLGKGGSSDLDVVLAASPFLAPGSQEVRVRIVDDRTGQLLAQAVLQVEAAAGRDLAVIADPLSGPPGRATAVLGLTNRGTSAATVALQLEGPEGWAIASVGAPLRLAPGASGNASLAIDIPAGTAPGSYRITVREAGRTVAEVPFLVTASPAFHAEVAHVARSGGVTEVWVRVRNTGNAAGVPPLDVAGNVTAAIIDPVPRELPPGETAVYRVTTGQAGEGEATLQIPGAQPIALEAVDATPRLQATAWGIEALGRPVAGTEVPLAVTVRNAGVDRLAGVPVRAFLDGLLVAERQVEVEPGEELRVELAVPLPEGSHVLGLSVGSGDDAELRTARVEVGPAREAPAPGVALALALVALAALARRRRGSR